MTTAQVRRLLGRPKRSFTEEEYRRGVTYVAGGGEDWLLDNEYWFYEGYPEEGVKTMITFHKGRVDKLTQGRTD